MCLGLREPEVGLSWRPDVARGARLQGTWGTGREGSRSWREGDGEGETRGDRLGKGREPGQGKGSFRMCVFVCKCIYVYVCTLKLYIYEIV